MSWNGYERNVLLRNDGHDGQGSLTFTNVAMALGADSIRDGRGMAVADFDNDGDLDIVIHNNPGDVLERKQHARATLLRNDIGAKRNWLAVELEGDKSNRNAVGARVRIEAGGHTQIRHVSLGSGYASQHSTRLYFGLDTITRVDRLQVRWPSGLTQQFDNLGTRQVIHITETGEMLQRDLPVKIDPIKLSSK